MLLAELWKSNRERCGGLFNLYFIWMYPIVIPFCFMWDFLDWLEKALTPNLVPIMDKPDWKEIDRAVYLVGQQFGHETAHLSAPDQIKAARNVILDMCDTIEQLASQANPEVEGQ